MSNLEMPGGILATRLQVYDSVGPDGQRGGTPHFHLACSEMYVVLQGRGAVEFIDDSGFARLELAPASAVVFSPGTVHRLINPDRDLEILVLMQNRGLPERGDNIGTFPRDVLADDQLYERAYRAATLEEATARRDLAVQGFVELKTAFEAPSADGRRALRETYELALERVRGRFDMWEEAVNDGPRRQVHSSLERISRLKRGDVDHLFDAARFAISPRAFSDIGWCGRLDRWFNPAGLELDGENLAQP